MDYIGTKLNSFTAGALGSISTSARKIREDSQPAPDEQMDDNVETLAKTKATGAIYARPQALSPLAGGIPFGGDTFSHPGGYARPPPPIGFRTDLIEQDKQRHSGSRQPPIIHSSTPIRQMPTGGDFGPVHKSESDESLYQADTWTRLWFQRVMILSCIRLLLFIRKVYEDFQATKAYNLTGQTGHFLIAAATLFLPTIIFTTYRVSRYLQVVLPPLRALAPAQQPNTQSDNQKQTTSSSDVTKQSGNFKKLVRDSPSADDDAQLTRALMSSPSGSSNIQQSTTTRPVVANNDDDGLVTARQTPTNLDEFHDSKSQQESAIELDRSSSIKDLSSQQMVEFNTPPSATHKPKLESVDVDKLGNLPDKETTRVVIGASEQILHGSLFVFWQLKRQVDVLGYLVERACLWRKPRDIEKEELDRLRTGSDGLEWFQDFYAAFLAIMMQVYTLGLHWSSGGASTHGPAKASAPIVGSSSPLASDSGEFAISQSARAISNTFSQQALIGDALGSKDLLIMSELIVSSAVVLSLLVAVRRRDDGPLTLGLSMIGWGSLFSARIIIIALAFVHIGWRIMLALVVVQVLGITIWIYKIAIDSHNDKPSERELEAKWDEETAAELTTSQAIGLKQSKSTQPTKADDKQDERQAGAGGLTSGPTNNWSAMEHVVLLAQILTLFAIPSLFYWPIMFNLKLHLRPFKYLVLILTQNFLLIPAIWLTISQSSATTPGQLYLLGAVGAFSIVGFIFVSLYISCKPSLTEYFARADEIFNEGEKAGIYFEFCSRVFKMPDLSKHSFRRLMNQSEKIVEEQYIEDDS